MIAVRDDERPTCEKLLNHGYLQSEDFQERIFDEDYFDNLLFQLPLVQNNDDDGNIQIVNPDLNYHDPKSAYSASMAISNILNTP